MQTESNFKLHFLHGLHGGLPILHAPCISEQSSRLLTCSNLLISEHPHEVVTAVTGAAVTGAAVIGAAVIGAAVMGAAVIGAAVMGAAVIGAAVMVPAVTGAVVTASVQSDRTFYELTWAT